VTINHDVASAVRRALLLSAVAAGAAAPVFAADTADNDKLEEVIVTGSRISQPNLTSTSPVVQVTAADIATQGVTRIEDLITQLPQAFAVQNSTVSNGSNGTATVSLRGLGAQRTLVLIDGRRMPYGAVSSSAADLNQVPTAMVERVDVLTGGASAVYGSDAIGGVVNFIMKKDFEGVQIDTQAGMYQHGNSFSGEGQLRSVIAGRAATNPSQFRIPDDKVTDGQSRQLNLTMGINSADGKGNLTAYAGVRTNDAVLEANRDFSACTLGAPNNTTHKWTCGGSSTSYPGRFLVYDNAFNLVGSYTVNPGTPGTFRNFNSSLDQYNFGPLNYFQRPDTTYTAGAMGHYELNPHADAYTQLMYTDYESVAQIAPGGDFGDTSYINCGNPLMSNQQATSLGCTATDIANDTHGPNSVYFLRRNVEGGGRQQAFHNQTFRGVAGVKGEIAGSWKYDASVQFSRLTADQQTLNNFVKPRIQNALDVVLVGGVPTCRSVVNGTDPNCVPYNVFTLGQVTPAQLNYLQAPGLQLGVIDQKITQFNITGDFGSFKSPLTSQPIAISFGYEGRRDSLSNTVDALQTNDQISGAGGPVIGLVGQTKADDLYTELRVPIANDMAAAKDLSVDAAFRRSNYGHSLTTNTYKGGIEWAPIADVRLRASYQRAVRAPNIIELFSAQGNNLFDMAGDPCGAQAPNPNATAAKCIASGVPAAAVGSVSLDSPAGQYNFLAGGNPNLQPEVSTTKSFGLILQPRFAPGLSLTFDYFDILIDKTISTFGASNLLNACYNTGDPTACGAIHRGPSGSLWLGSGFVQNTNINIGSIKTKGLDITVDYNNISLGAAGRLGVSLQSTHLNEFVVNPGPGIPSYDCVGQYSSSCGTPTPAWRHHLRVSYKTPVQGLDMAVTYRYMSAVDIFVLPGGTRATGLGTHFGAQGYVDLAGNYAITEKASIRGGINNILDRDPPISNNVGTTGNGNTYPQTYDSLGRYMFLGVQYKF
jgi:iron complex outermembrane recepter protein